MKQVGLWIGVGATAVYILVILWFRGSDFLCFLKTGSPNEFGDFLAGFFTPLAFLWLVVGYFMQHAELGLQREELKHQREELALTRDKLGEQVELLQEQVKADYEKTLPHLRLKPVGTELNDRKWRIYNDGETALEVVLSRVEGNGEKQKCDSVDKINRDRYFQFGTPFPTNESYEYEVEYVSVLGKRDRRRWQLNPDHSYKEITDGPTSLEEA